MSRATKCRDAQPQRDFLRDLDHDDDLLAELSPRAPFVEDITDVGELVCMRFE